MYLMLMFTTQTYVVFKVKKVSKATLTHLNPKQSIY